MHIVCCILSDSKYEQLQNVQIWKYLMKLQMQRVTNQTGPRGTKTVCIIATALVAHLS